MPTLYTVPSDADASVSASAAASCVDTTSVVLSLLSLPLAALSLPELPHAVSARAIDAAQRTESTLFLFFIVKNPPCEL
jgi:hypothetical protein